MVCYTIETEPKKVFFRVIRDGKLGTVSEVLIDNRLNYGLWDEDYDLSQVGDKLWFVNTLNIQHVYELAVTDR